MRSVRTGQRSDRWDIEQGDDFRGAQQRRCDPDESDRWSRALGDYTAMIDITSGGGQAPEKPSVATSPQVARLMTKEGLTAMASNELIGTPIHALRGWLRMYSRSAACDSPHPCTNDDCGVAGLHVIALPIVRLQI